jgi:hypothetical protein
MGSAFNAVAPGAFASGITKVAHSSPENAGEAKAATAQKMLDARILRMRKSRPVYLTIGEGRDVTGKLISAVWDH